MDLITKEQHDILLQGMMPQDLPLHIKKDIELVKTIALSVHDEKHYVAYVEENELCDAEIEELKATSKVVNVQI